MAKPVIKRWLEDEGLHMACFQNKSPRSVEICQGQTHAYGGWDKRTQKVYGYSFVLH